VPASAACLALIAAACGGSSTSASRRHGATGTRSASSAVTRTTLPPPTPAQISRAAKRTANEPGYRAVLSARINLPQFNGSAVTAIGGGYFDPGSSSGSLDVAIELPGLLGLPGPFAAQLRLVGSEAYVQVPSDLATQTSTDDSWLQESIAALGLGDSLDPPDILREIARDATRPVPGQGARVTLDASTGLVRTIALSYRRPGGYRIRIHLRFTGFGRQPATSPPPPADTGDLQTALQELGF
jgi:hypothetical protein